MKELMIAIDSLKKGRSADSKGIKAEDVKGADEETRTMIHEIFDLIIKQNSMAPSSWKQLRKETRQIQRTTGRSVVFHNFTKTPNLIITSVQTRQASVTHSKQRTVL